MTDHIPGTIMTIVHSVSLATLTRAYLGLKTYLSPLARNKSTECPLCFPCAIISKVMFFNPALSNVERMSSSVKPPL